MVIAIRLFTHPHTCDKGLALFAAMNRLNCESTTKVPYLAFHPLREKWRKMFSLFLAVLTVLVLSGPFPPS